MVLFITYIEQQEDVLNHSLLVASNLNNLMKILYRIYCSNKSVTYFNFLIAIKYITLNIEIYLHTRYIQCQSYVWVYSAILFKEKKFFAPIATQTKYLHLYVTSASAEFYSRPFPKVSKRLTSSQIESYTPMWLRHLFGCVRHLNE